MTPEEIDSFLQQSLSDHRLTRGEKRVLHDVVDDLDGDAHKLDLLRSQAYRLARDEMIDPDSKAVLDWLEGVDRLLHAPVKTSETKSIAHFSPGENCVQLIVDMFIRCRTSVDVCVFTITDDRISSAILDAHRRKRRIRVISDADKAHDIGSDIAKLSSAGIEVRVDRSPALMHHKFAVFDNSHVLTGSYNWTRSAANLNAENVIMTNDTHLVPRFSTVFEDLWRHLY